MPLSVQIALLLSVALIHRKEESRLASVHPPLSKEGKQSRHRSRTKTQDSTDLQKLGAEKQQPGDNSKEPLMDPHPNVLRWGSSCLLKSQQPDGKVFHRAPINASVHYQWPLSGSEENLRIVRLRWTRPSLNPEMASRSTFLAET
ncbi:hypothetical protein NN561_001136 [Cricetulus griseus]